MCVGSYVQNTMLVIHVYLFCERVSLMSTRILEGYGFERKCISNVLSG